jgi:hypothetical protein
MHKDPNSTSNEPSSKPSDTAPGALRSLLVAAKGETHELWRVVSSDGSSRVFQTKPTVDARRRPPQPSPAAQAQRGAPCKLAAAQSGPAMFDRNAGNLPTLIAEEAPAAGSPDAGLATELTSVTQAWPTLSPGIRGAVMALIRAATTPRKGGPSPQPRRG